MDSKTNKEAITPTVQLGGRMWPLKLTHGVLMLFSSSTRLSMDQMQYQIGRYDYMVLLLWLMCRAQDPQLKREKFDAWLDDLGVAGVVDLLPTVADAFQAAFPSEDEAEDPEDADDDNPDPDVPDPT